MQYRIGWIAKQFGITPQLMRFYENEGLLISGRDDDSLTRHYYARSFKWLSNLRRLFMLGYTVKEIRQIYRTTTLEELVDHFLAKQQEIDCEINRLKGLSQSLTDRVADCKNAKQNLGKVELRYSPPMYLLINQLEQSVSRSDEIIRMVQSWTAHLPFIFSASLVDLNNKYRRRSGFCVKEDTAKTLGLPTEKPVQFLPSVLCVHSVLVLSDKNPPTSMFQNIETFIHENKLSVIGSAFGYALASTHLEHCKYDLCPEKVYYEYWIPVEKTPHHR